MSDLRCDFVVVSVLQHQHVDADAAQVPAQALQHVVTHHPQLLRRYGSFVLLSVLGHTLVLTAHTPAGTLMSLEKSQTPTLGFKANTIRTTFFNWDLTHAVHFIQQVIKLMWEKKYPPVHSGRDRQ